MAWSKLKSMFVVSDQPAQSTDDVMKDLEKYQVPEGEPGALPEGTSPQMLSGQIDFQGLYDQAGIPNTDEVESLERFLIGLDESLPATAKVAAAKAFLGAIGKAAKDVLTDARRKIQVVRAVGEVKGTDASNRQRELQSEITRLESEIEQCRSAMESINAELEGVRHQCAVEEGRLQAARVFFGHLGNVQK